jgi:hypothetical protein
MADVPGAALFLLRVLRAKSGQLGEGCPDVADKSLRLFEGEQ